MVWIGAIGTARAVLAVGDHEWDPVIMTAIAGAESGYDTEAVSPTNDWGLFQINRDVWGWLFDQYDWADPIGNTTMALIVWRSQGYNAWVAYWTGRYLDFFNEAITAVRQLEEHAPPPPPPSRDPNELSSWWDNFQDLVNNTAAHLFSKLGDAINIYRSW